jgi:hypothetical protein
MILSSFILLTPLISLAVASHDPALTLLHSSSRGCPKGSVVTILNHDQDTVSLALRNFIAANSYPRSTAEDSQVDCRLGFVMARAEPGYQFTVARVRLEGEGYFSPGAGMNLQSTATWYLEESLLVSGVSLPSKQRHHRFHGCHPVQRTV